MSVETKQKQNNMSNVSELFIIASRKKYRFASSRGLLGVDDVWDLSLENVDQMAVSLDKEIQKAGEKSFLKTRATSTTDLENKLELLKYIISIRQQEIDDRKARADKQARRAQLTELLQKKEMNELESKSKDELLKELAALD